MVSRSQVARHAVGDLVGRMFEGSAERLVLSLVETRQLTPEKLAELSALIENSEKSESPEEGHGND